MKKIITLVVMLLCLQLWAQAPDSTSAAPGRLIIKVNQAFMTIGTRSDGIIETDQTWFNNLAIQYQIDELKQLYKGSSLSGLQNKYLICFPETCDLEAVAASFEQQSQVQNVRYNLIFQPCTNDPFNSYQWNLRSVKANAGYYNIADNIQAPQAVRIAVIDTGIDYNHPDIANNILRDGNNNVIGYNAIDSTEPIMDNNGHGTLVAGIIAANTNNNQGISSLVSGNNVKLMPIKAFNLERIGYLSDICEAVLWSLTQGANIINCSWITYQNDNDGHYYPDDLRALIESNPSVLFVAARGAYDTVYPASWAAEYGNVVAVGGSNIDNKRQCNGSDGWISVCAPSGALIHWSGPHDTINGILSTVPLPQTPPYYMHHTQQNYEATTYGCGSWPESTDYDFYKGTSLAAAHVSGLASMLFAQHYSLLTSQPPSWYAADLKDIIVKSAQDFNENNYSIYNGWGSGIINAHEALMDPHPNLSLRQYQIGADDVNDRYNYPIDETTLVWNLPSMEWGSSQPVKLQIKNKWAAGTNVRVRLSTTDTNITFSYPGGSDRYSIGNINAGETIWTGNMWMRDWTNQVRTNVPITITISATGMPDREYTIYINVLQNTQTIVGTIAMLQGETITTDLVVSNIDGHTGDDELFVGTSAGRLFCYKNNVWIHVDTLPQGFSVSPSVGDINADGQKEVVAIDPEGNVYVYDKNLTLLKEFPCSTVGEVVVGSSILEDVTGDGILDIIYCTTDTIPRSVVNVIDFAKNTNHKYQTMDMIIVAAPAIGDVDHHKGYEIVVPYKSLQTSLFAFKVLKYNNGSLIADVERTSNFPTDSALPPSIVDLNEDGGREIAFMVNGSNGIACNFVYSVPDGVILGGHDILSTKFYNREISKLIYSSSKVAQVYSMMTVQYNPGYTEKYGFSIVNGGPEEWLVPTTVPTVSKVKRIIVDDLFVNENGFHPQEIAIMTDNEIQYYKISYFPGNPEEFQANNEIWEYRTSLGNTVTLVSMATANSGSNRILYAISKDGKLYGYSFGECGTYGSECSQYRQTARHTGCYEQPIPREITTEDITIKHPFVIERPVTVRRSEVTINGGVVGRFEANTGLILNRSALNINGSEQKPVILTGLSSGKSSDYWKGITVSNGSDLDMYWAEVSGAYQALDISSTGSRLINSSKFYNNSMNVKCYNATANLYYNYLTDAQYAVSAFHYARPMLNGRGPVQNGLNEIVDNDYGIFSDCSNPVLDVGHNNLENYNYNLFLQNLPLFTTLVPAENNWWGSNNHREVAETINLPNSVSFVPFDMQANETIIRETQSSGMFENGYAHMLNGDYRNAIESFNCVLADSLINENDVVSLYAMFECYKQLGEIILFEDVINQYLANGNYSLLHKPMKNVRALIFRETERFSLAIDHYESILLNNPSFQDSCYAVIDLGDTYLESNLRSSGQLTQYIPVSYEIHQLNRETLLNSIANLYMTGNSTGSTPPIQLLGNYPNPFNPSTTIRFQMKADSNVKVDIFNIRGQKVTTLLNESRPAGLNSVIWDGRDSKKSPVSSGVYFYRIESSNYSKTAKMLLLK